MSRAAHFLLKIPTIRRLMVRLGNLEAAMLEHRSQIDVVNSTMTDLNVKLNDVNDSIVALRKDIERLDADRVNARASPTEIAGHMPPEQGTALEAQVHALTVSMSELHVQFYRVSAQIEQLSAGQNARRRATPSQNAI